MTGQNIFESDGKERMPKLGWVVGIPEEGMVGVGAYAGCQAWIGNVGKSEVGGSRLDRIQQAEYIHAQDVNVLAALFPRQQFIELVVRCIARRFCEADVSGRRRQETHIEEIGNDEVLRAGFAEQTFAVRKSLRDLPPKRFRRSARAIQNVVPAALQDVEGVWIGLAAVIA